MNEKNNYEFYEKLVSVQNELQIQGKKIIDKKSVISRNAKQRSWTVIIN